MYPNWLILWKDPLVANQKPGLQIMKRISTLVENETFNEGDRLPPVYLLAKKLGTTSMTVNQAYNKLKEIHLVEIKKGKGTYIATFLPNIKVARQKVNSIGYLSPDDTIHPFPLQPSNQFLVLGSGLPDLGRLPVMQYLNFYRKIVKDISENIDMEQTYRKEVDQNMLIILGTRGININNDQYIVVPNGNALNYVIKSITVPGDIVLMEERSDYVPFHLFHQQGAVVKFWGATQNHKCLQNIEAICKKNKIKVLFVRPSGSYPSLTFLNEDERNGLVALSIRYKFWLISTDENYQWWHKQPIAPLILRRHQGNIFHITSVNLMLPTIEKMEFVVADSSRIAQIRNEAYFSGNTDNLPIELTISRLMTRNWLNDDSTKLLKFYKNRQIKIKEIFDRILVNYAELKLSRTGLYVYIQFYHKINLKYLIEEMQKNGHINFADNLHINANSPVAGIRIGYARLELMVIEKIFTDIATFIGKSKGK